VSLNSYYLKGKQMVRIFILSFTALLCFGKVCGVETHIVKLRCEYLDSPLSIDVEHPRFMWSFDSGQNNFEQKAYQIRVASDSALLHTDNADVWKSEVTGSNIPKAIYAGRTKLKSHHKYYWNVTVWDKNGKEYLSSAVAVFEIAKLTSDDWQAQWITDDKDKNHEPSPMFRKQFDITKEIASARAYICSAGYYEMFLNGNRVGDHYLDPGYTHFDKRLLYVVHDVTALLKMDENALAVVLGNGWFNCQSRAVWDFEKARWRDRPRMLCELRITYSDGTTDVVKSDDTWKTSEGAYVYNNIYSGDFYDARQDKKGWTGSSFNDSKWRPARVTKSPSPLIVSQKMPAIRITKEIRPKLIKSFRNRIYVFDMGENFSGICRLKVKGGAGTIYTLRHGELLKKNGRLEQRNIGIYYHPMKMGEGIQTDVFTLKGGGKEEVFEPRFSYHGFRYVEVECSRRVLLTEDNLDGLFLHTDVPQVGKFSCSNKLLNKIWAATNQSYKSNLHSIPTDCPQREKNGWTADAFITIDLALLNFDGITFYEKWMNDFIDNQREDGSISGIIPSAGWGYGDWPGPVWDAALFIIPNALYNYYGDTHSIEELYPTMEKYLKYLEKKEVDGGLNFGLGDWVFYKSQTPNDYTSTVFYYLDYKLMARFASLLGKDASGYKKKAQKLKELINNRYFDPVNGIYANGTQTAQALALYLNLVPEDKEQQVADNLYKRVSENNYFLDFGLIGSKTVPAMLAKYGYVEAAYKMITKTEAPSWGYWVDTQGYSTLAETWTLSPKFRDASINHVFMGDVSAWMYNVLAGINYDNRNPGFENIIIKPHFVEDLRWVRAQYNSVRGLVSSQWNKSGNQVDLVVRIPSGSTATIHADKEYNVGSGTHRYTYKLIP